MLIVGAGPAGLATALYLIRRRPDLAGRVIALEKAAHPRPKVCAGGLIPKTMLALDELGLDLGVPAVEVRRAVARTELGAFGLGGREALCTVVRRDLFDARLADAARGAGVEIVEHCRALDIEHSSAGARVITERGIFEAPVVVGADGSGSRIASRIFGRRKQSIGRALMTDLPVDPAATEEFTHSSYRFDFRCVAAGIKGYSWSFPCLIDGRPHLNVGIYDQCPREAVEPGADKAPMLAQLHAAFPELPLDGRARIKAFPIRWYDPRDRFAAPGVILAGDAAGVDPLMGEGISCAFEHGKLAADALARYLDGAPDALSRYGAALHQSTVGRKLRKLAFAARRFYGPRHRLYFRLAGFSRCAQEIGMDWYNGARHTDELPTLRLLARWTRAVLFTGSMG